MSWHSWNCENGTFPFVGEKDFTPYLKARTLRDEYKFNLNTYKANFLDYFVYIEIDEVGTCKRVHSHKEVERIMKLEVLCLDY